MKISNEEIYERIERYIFNQMKDEERITFEEELLFNRELREKLQRIELIYDGISEVSDEQQPPSEKQHNTQDFNFMKLAAMVLVIILSATFYMKQSGFDIAVYMDGGDDMSQEFYAANYEPNPYLEDYITGVFRTDQDNITITIPEADLRYQWHNGEKEINITAVVPERFRTEPLHFKLYTNNVEDYINEQSLMNIPANIDANGTIDTTLRFELSPGLYYLVLENVRTAEPRGIRRIFVER